MKRMLDDLLEEEKINRFKKSENQIIEANIKLVDRIKWFKEEIEREIYKIKNENVDIEIIIKDLENILRKNN